MKQWPKNGLRKQRASAIKTQGIICLASRRHCAQAIPVLECILVLDVRPVFSRAVQFNGPLLSLCVKDIFRMLLLSRASVVTASILVCNFLDNALAHARSGHDC